MTQKRMSKKQIKLAVIDALNYCGKFVPANYGEDYREELTAAAWELVKENFARWFYMSDGTLQFLPE